MALSPGHTPQEIQNHLYQSFLQRATTDITLQVRARGWNVSYELHRVVLIQAGFFRSLFTSGFLESSRRSSSSTVKPFKDVINVQFDDPNITRAAFEICVASLYGGGPQLHLNSALIPTTAHPLTAHFPASPPSSAPPPNYHPASPRFLLSLIATSIYLSIPTITARALGLVLKIIGPTTVTRFLNFAIGKGIGEPDELEPVCAVGLEDVGLEFLPDDVKRQPSTGAERLPEQPALEQDDGVSQKISGRSVSSDDDDSSSPSIKEGFGRFDMSSSTLPVFSYGIVSDKIGEACACWMVRWGSDMLSYEEEYSARLDGSGTTSRAEGSRPVSQPPSKYSPSRSASPRPHDKSTLGLSMHRRATLPSSATSPFPGVPPSKPLLLAGQSAPAIWSRRGLTTPWAVAILSSDDLFVRGGERERYVFATRVVELRKKEALRDLQIAKEVEIALGGDGTVAEELYNQAEQVEELEWDGLFRYGIYYSHMSFDDLLYIRHDISPSSHKPYILLSTLQHAHWNQSLLRSKITSSRQAVSSPDRPGSPPLPQPGSSPSSSGQTNSSPQELNVAISTSDIVPSISPDATDSLFVTPTTYFPVFGDKSQKVGGDSLPTSSEEWLLFSSGVAPSRDAGKRVNDESNFFGIRSSRRMANEIIEEDPSGKALWTENEPYRFSVEFWDAESLKQQQRLYSHTVWCSGNLWNVYVQIVRKKGLQLGVYLQRQSFVDPLPPHSTPTPPSPSLHHSFSLPAFSPPVGTSSTISHQPSGTSAARRSSDLLSSPVSTPTRSRPWAIPNASSTSNVSLIRSPTPSIPLASPIQAYGVPSTSGLTTLNGGTPPSASPSTPLQSSLAATSPSQMPFSPYRDPRQSIRAYFSIACPSATGSSSTKFSSSPDVFNVTNSWGWKSSKAEEWLDFDEPTNSDAAGVKVRAKSKDVSLRATIVLGLV